MFPAISIGKKFPKNFKTGESIRAQVVKETTIRGKKYESKAKIHNPDNYFEKSCLGTEGFMNMQEVDKGWGRPWLAARPCHGKRIPKQYRWDEFIVFVLGAGESMHSSFLLWLKLIPMYN